ncbi:alanine racemase [Aeromicrobium sp. P5_D10]
MTARALAQTRQRDGRSRLHIDLAAVAANTELLAALAPGDLMAVVKADGFGHGAEDIARTALAHGASWLGVTSIAEALPLRDAGLNVPILSWLNHCTADFAEALEADLDLAVPDLGHLDAIARAAALSQRPARVHLHLDSGMARDGAAPDQWRALCGAARAAERQGWIKVVGIMSHLGCAGTPGHRANLAARTRFARGLSTAQAAGLRPSRCHLAATAAVLTDPASHHSMVRVGAGLVGIDPTGGNRLRPALTLTSPLVGVRHVRAGTPVGYDHSWLAPAATNLGLVALGYADGLPRAASGRAEVLVAGRRCRVVGLISMDQMVVDLGDLPVAAGEPVTVIGTDPGNAPTTTEWAAWADTIEHEIVTGLRVRGAIRTTSPASPSRLRSIS